MSIRVLISTKKFKGGPLIFRHRIAAAINKIDGFKVTRDHKKKFDVELSVIRLLHDHKKPKVLRVDGCYYTKNEIGANRNLVVAMQKSNFVVFQSKFSKKMCYSILKMKPNKRAIIRNGIDFDYIDGIKPNHRVVPGSFVACAQWRDSKRPLSTIKGFLSARTGRNLYVIGENANRFWTRQHPNIHLLGKMTEEESIAVMKACSYMIHLCYIDSCPNAVVEGVACGLNVLCTNLGGTKEIVKDRGFVLEADHWSGAPQKPRLLDTLDSRIVAAGVENVLKVKKQSRPDYLNINHVAQDYAEVIKKVL